MKYALLLTLSVSSYTFARSPYILETELESFSYSDISPIKQLIDDLEGPAISRGDHAFSHNQWTASIKNQGVGVHVFSRLDYLFEFNPDTAQLLYLDKNNQAVGQDENYTVDLQVNALRASGFAISYEYQLKGHVIAARLNRLFSTYMLEGGIEGSVSTSAEGFQGDLSLNYNYARDSLLKRPQEPIDGKGYSLDLDWQWQVSERVTLVAKARDLWSKMDWDVTYTIANATTDTLSYDEDGTLSAIPVLSGIESRHDYVQRLPKRLHLNAGWDVDQHWQVAARLMWIDRYPYHSVAVARQLGDMRVELNYNLISQGLGAKIDFTYGYLGVQADHVDIDKTHGLAVTAGLKYQF